jgi:hypothetical protein
MSNGDKKIVYFAGAIRGDRAMADTIKQTIFYIKELGFPVLTEHVGTDDPIATFAGKVGKTKDTLTAADVEKQDIAWLDQATHVIAEISGASTGTGREIEYARTKGELGMTPAQILCVYHGDREFFASPMVRGMSRKKYPNVRIKKYTDAAAMKKIVKDFLES